MRWLLIKDLQILRRSPLVTSLLVIYPIVIAVLVGFALSRGPDKPRVAFLNQVPAGQSLSLGKSKLSQGAARDELCGRIDCIDVDSRQEAIDKVKSGEVLAALILPADLIEKLRSTLTTNDFVQPTVDVIVNEEDPVKRQLVDDRISALVNEANLKVSGQFSDALVSYLQLLLKGGKLGFLGQNLEILGLDQTQTLLENVAEKLPPRSADRAQVGQVIHFAKLARQNLSVADDLLASVQSPIKVDKEVVSGSAPELDNFAISVAATITLMFVTVLLVAGSLALEREENTFKRITRGLVSGTGLLAEKVFLGVVCSFAVTALMLGGLELFVSIDWGRAPLIGLAILVGAAGFAAMGAAIGAAAPEVRASSLLAFMISLPIAFLSLVPSGAVGPGVYDAIKVVAAIFPFKAAQQAMAGALDPAGPGLGVAALHMAALVAAYAGLARVALRRIAAA
jgi:ABC-type transport system involved in cytochrome c biogenesis permease component